MKMRNSVVRPGVPTRQRIAAEVNGFREAGDMRRHRDIAEYRVWGPITYSLVPWGLCARLTWLKVDPRYARLGWGRRFLERLCLWADTRGVPLELEADPHPEPSIPGDRLQALYESFGFRRTRGWTKTTPTMRRPVRAGAGATA